MLVEKREEVVFLLLIDFVVFVWAVLLLDSGHLC